MRTTTGFHFFLAALVAVALIILSQSGTLAQGPTPPRPRSAAGVKSPSGTGDRLTYQGRLTNSSGAPINSTVQMIFKIYDAGGALQWTSATRTVTPANGLFTVYLGEDPDPGMGWDLLPEAASIGVTVGSDAEMTPRQPLNTVVGHSVIGSGVAGGSQTGHGVTGVSGAGIGVYAESFSSNALAAASGGAGRDNATIRADNSTNPTGMVGYFTNNSNYATAHFYNAGAGQVFFLQNGYSGTTASNGTGGGAFIEGVNGPGTATLFKVDNKTNFSQLRDASGLVKAGAKVNCGNFGYSIAGQFNNVNGATITVDGQASGHCILDFGFQVSDRFFVAMAEGTSANFVTCDIGSTNTKLNCNVYTAAGTLVNSYFTVMIY